jgi:hypothetical protein
MEERDERLSGLVPEARIVVVEPPEIVELNHALDELIGEC